MHYVRLTGERLYTRISLIHHTTLTAILCEASHLTPNIINIHIQ